MKKTFLTLPFCLFAVSALAQNTHAFDINQRLGRGINMGNTFEAPTETAWGNPWKPEYFRIMSELGFQHVRLPVRWEPADRSLAGPPYTISDTFLSRIREVVDSALANNLMIIINMHHHDSLYIDPEGQKARFLSQWNQIASYFSDYPDELLFEVLNEPHGNLTPDKWNEFFAGALAEIRKTNPTRIVIMGTAEYGGLGGLSYLQLPADENIILTIHYYNPFNFTHQGADWVGEQSNSWLGTEWLDTEAERQTVESEFAPALAFSQEHNIPLYIGEFGAYSRADMDSRVRWTTFLSRWFEQQQMSWAYWEFSAGFGIYDPITKQLLQPLSDALLQNEMPEPLATVSKEIYQSNFTSGADGWNIFTQGGADAGMSAGNGKLDVSINNGGTQSWHVQLTKTGLPLYKGKMYRITITASSSVTKSATVYAGRNSDPWTSYSGYSGISLSPEETTYSITFTMNNDTDLQSRLAIDAGLTSGEIVISEITLEELSYLTTSLDPEAFTELLVYPNPVLSRLYISRHGSYSHAQLYNIEGTILQTIGLGMQEDSFSMENYPAGLYLVSLSGKGMRTHTMKVVKR